MIPSDPPTLKRLRSAWDDPEVTAVTIRQRFRITPTDEKVLVSVWGPRVPPSPMPEWGGIRKRTNRQLSTWRRTDDERRARRRAELKEARR